MPLEIKLQQLHSGAKMPTYATDGSGAFDFYSIEGIHLPWGRAAKIQSLGFSCEIPKDHVLLMFSRSGHADKYSIRLANSVGVIDSDYRGELKVMLFNDGPEHVYLKPGERIAQGIVIPRPRCIFKWVDSLSETNRGIGGFGSTNK